MDLELLTFRALVMSKTREFFHAKGYLETDTPALSPALIPETCLEVFRADYLKPWKEGEEAIVPLFLVPSPEIYLKELIARFAVSLFQISKCYRNLESTGRVHSPEFTMLEYYTMQADYRDSLSLTKSFLDFLCDACAVPRWEYEELTMDEAFYRFAGFKLSDCQTSLALSLHAQRLGLGSASDYESWPWDDLYELILVHTVEGSLDRQKAVFLTDYPARVPCLAKERGESWKTKERWELYIRGVEIANCYTEERDAHEIRSYIRKEGRLKSEQARVPHPVRESFAETCSRMPPCSGVAVGLDRLIMSLSGLSSIESVLPFPFGQN